MANNGEKGLTNITLKNREDIAVMKRDLQYVSQKIDELTRVFNDFKDNGFVTKAELEETVKPLRDGVNRVLWIIITTVVVGLLGLLIKPTIPLL